MNKEKKLGRDGEVVKENVLSDGVVDTRWLAAAALLTGAALLVARACDSALPPPLDRAAPPDRFIADIAYDHLLNLTAIGPRVAGSYENEVAAVRVLVAAARGVQAAASAHNRVEVDVFSASGAFALTFIDGMSNMYRDVQSVAIRVRGAGGAPPGRAPRRHALLLNCHYDTVPDSPGASDDGAGCAVVLETLRALAAAPRPLRHDVVALLNGAEENILQASHAFVTTHKWAKSLRAFINIEACGAGGREVLFQAGPHDPWILEVYAGRVPHPFASSLAQELFESGLIPADTDFRIFRDYANISGVDLAWSSNGFVYHTRLDTAERVPRAALQRTGDNVLALAHGLLQSERLEEATERSRAPVYFDVLGVLVLHARAPAAAAAALLVVALVLLAIARSARRARRELYVPARVWLRVVGRALLSVVLAQCCGLAAAVGVALALHAAGARLAFYSHTWLLLPLYAAPAALASWWDARLTWGKARRAGGAAALARGAWAVRAWQDAHGAAAAAALAAGAALGLRSAFVALLWALPGASSLVAPRGPRARALLWAAAAALPALQTAYLALGCVHMFVPVMGRAGTSPVPPDVIMAVIVGSLTLMTFSWMLPFVVAAKRPQPLMYIGWSVTLVTFLLVVFTPLGFPYSEQRPQRLMLFHTRRTVHALAPGPAPGHAPGPARALDSESGDVTHEDMFWIPELDANTPRTIDDYVSESARAQATGALECARWPYCGAPYYLPVTSLVARGHALPAPAPPAARLRLAARLERAAPATPAAPAAPATAHLHLNLTGPNHIVVILSPREGGTVEWCSAPARGAGGAELRVEPVEGPRWARGGAAGAGGDRTYFVALHDARAPAPWLLTCLIRRAAGEGGAGGAGGAWVDVSAAGHSMFGAGAKSAAHSRLAARLPRWLAATGWGVHLHLAAL